MRTSHDHIRLRAGIFERVVIPEIPPRVQHRFTSSGNMYSKLLREVEKLQAEVIAKILADIKERKA